MPSLKPDMKEPECDNLSDELLHRRKWEISMTTDAIARRRKPRGLHPKKNEQAMEKVDLPEYPRS